MIVLVDTSVWIDFFRNRPTTETAELERLITDDADLAVCGLILTELLQGIRSEADCRAMQRKLETLLYLPLDRGDYEAAADLYRSARRRGGTIRNSADCIIAATAIRHDAVLLHADRDFQTIAAVSRLNCWRPA